MSDEEKDERRRLQSSVDELRGMMLMLGAQFATILHQGGRMPPGFPPPGFNPPGFPPASPEGWHPGAAHEMSGGEAQAPPPPAAREPRAMSRATERIALNPHCVRCQRPMQNYKARGKPGFRCGQCQAAVVAHRIAPQAAASAPVPAGAVVPSFGGKKPDERNPFCLSCKRQTGRRSGGIFRCRGCGIKIKEAESASRAAPAKAPARRAGGRRRRGARRASRAPQSKGAPLPARAKLPHCLKCRERMQSAGKWSVSGSPRVHCRSCGASLYLRQEAHPLAPEAPFCVSCREPMKACGFSAKGARHYACRPCKASVVSFKSRRPKRRMSDEEASALLFSISSKIPASVPEELRGDVRQSIARDIIAGELELSDLTPARLSAYIRAEFRAAGNRFKEISLESQIGEDGLRLEERLAG